MVIVVLYLGGPITPFAMMGIIILHLQTELWYFAGSHPTVDNHIEVTRKIEKLYPYTSGPFQMLVDDNTLEGMHLGLWVFGLVNNILSITHRMSVSFFILQMGENTKYP
jgi:hypothetical protein